MTDIIRPKTLEVYATEDGKEPYSAQSWLSLECATDSRCIGALKRESRSSHHLNILLLLLLLLNARKELTNVAGFIRIG